MSSVGCIKTQRENRAGAVLCGKAKDRKNTDPTREEKEKQAIGRARNRKESNREATNRKSKQLEKQATGKASNWKASNREATNRKSKQLAKQATGKAVPYTHIRGHDTVLDLVSRHQPEQEKIKKNRKACIIARNIPEEKTSHR